MRLARQMYEETGLDGKRAHTVAEIAAGVRCNAAHHLPIPLQAGVRLARQMYEETGLDGKRAHTVAEIAAGVRCNAA
ncbi:hypothetical protein CTI14_69645, partial [Methylobacterium radiotolerans]